jgi:hypothetical protein
MGLHVSVYRNAELRGDFTNGGISSSADHLTVVNVSGPFEPSDDAPAVALIDGALGTKILVPVLQDSKGKWQRVRAQGHVGPMAGGNYAASSDSRFGEAVGFYGAVSIHDRFETMEQYALLSQ